MRKKHPFHILYLLLCSFILLLSGCGNMADSQGGSHAPANFTPDQVQIEITGGTSSNDKPRLTLTDKARVQKLYAVINALPAMPTNIACTMESGPSYQLIFQQAKQQLAPMNAQSFGCRPIFLNGTKDQRQTSNEFWQLLNQDIYDATPLTKVQSIAIQRTQFSNLTAQTAQLTSAGSAQKFYEATLALPQLKVEDDACYNPIPPDYQLMLRTANQAVQGCISSRLNRITIHGEYKLRGGTYAIDEQFRHRWQALLASVTFAPARPDHLLIQLDRYTQRSTITVQDAHLRDALYNKTLALPSAEVPSNCPAGGDKIAHKQVFFWLHFTQWGLPIRAIEAYEGSCKEVQNQTESATEHFYTADDAFWTMLHNASAIK